MCSNGRLGPPATQSFVDSATCISSKGAFGSRQRWLLDWTMDMGWCTQGHWHRRLHTSGNSEYSCGEFPALDIDIAGALGCTRPWVCTNESTIIVGIRRRCANQRYFCPLCVANTLQSAHSCIGNHPSSRILRDFYHASTAEARPSILGLSASPVVNSKVGNLGWVT